MKLDKAQIVNMLTNTPDSTSTMGWEDIKNNRMITFLSYLSILFLVPMFLRKDSKFARYHVNQGLTLCLVEIIGNALLSICEKLPLIGWAFTIVKAIFGLATLLLTLIGLYNVYQGKAKQLPFIGKYTFLK